MRIIDCTKNCCSRTGDAIYRFACWNGRKVVYITKTIGWASYKVVATTAFVIFTPPLRIGKLALRVLKFIYGIEEAKPKKKRKRSFCVIHADSITIKSDKIEVRKNSTPQSTLTIEKLKDFSKPAESAVLMGTVIDKPKDASADQKEQDKVGASSELSSFTESEIISAENVAPVEDPKAKKMVKSRSESDLSEALRDDKNKMGPPPYRDSPKTVPVPPKIEHKEEHKRVEPKKEEPKKVEPVKKGWLW